MANIKFKVKNLRSVTDPILGKNNQEGKESWVCYVNLNDIPEELENWMDVNPRKQNLKTNVSKEIKNSIDNSNNFHLLNRGLLILIDELKANKISDLDYEIEIELNNHENHGLVDGGHTFKCILDKKEEKRKNNSKLSPNFVFIQFIKGVDNHEVIELAAARNTSTEVDTKSIAELEKRFDDIKTIISNSEFSFLIKNISFKQNDKKPIDAREIVALLCLFNPKINRKINNPGESSFIQAYNSRQAVLEKFLKMIKENENEIKKMSNIFPIVLKLWETIQKELPNKIKKYGIKKYANYEKGKKPNKTSFTKEAIAYNVPNALIYPIIAGFAQLIEYSKSTEKYFFKYNPFDVWKNTSETIGERVASSSKTNGHAPNNIGKDNELWNSVFQTILIDTKITNIDNY